MWYILNIVLRAQLSQFRTVTLQIKPVKHFWSLKGKRSFPPLIRAICCLCFVCSNVKYESTVGTCQQEQGLWGSIVPRRLLGWWCLPAGPPQTYWPAGWMLSLSAVRCRCGPVWVSAADPGDSTSSRNQTTETNTVWALNHCKEMHVEVLCFHFTPLEGI